jgi:hypothetical protein
MKIDNTKFNLSLNNTSHLRQLIIDNPDLPLLIFCGEESWCGEWAYSQADASKGEIQTLTLRNYTWVAEDEYRDWLYDELSFNEAYKDLSDEEYDQMIDQKMAETEFCKAIVIYVG